MWDTRFKNLYDALTTHINYCNLIESYGAEKVPFENTNLDLLQVIFSGFYMTLTIDDYIKKSPDGKRTSRLVPEFVKVLANTLAIDNGKGYTLGNLSYKDEYEVIEKVRNKMAHGDFIVRDGEIIFEEKKIEGKIKINDLMKFISIFETLREDYLLGSRTKTLFLNSTDRNKICSNSDLNKACERIYIVKITDSPIFPNVKTVGQCQLIKQVHEKLTKKVSETPNFTKKDIEDLLKIYKQYLKNKGIDISYSIKKISELDEFQEIKQKYKANKDLFDRADKKDQVTGLATIAFRLIKGEHQKFDIQKGILENGITISALQKNPNTNLFDIINQFGQDKITYLLYLESSIITSYLVAFNSFYEYGLEKGLTLQGAYNWISIFIEKSLDFSKLNLEQLDDPKMLIEHNFDKYNSDVSNFEEECLNWINEKISKYEKSLEDYLNKAKIKTEQTETKLRDRLSDVQEEKCNILKTMELLKEQYKKFDLEKYTRNINIIIHIRNAIAHGNIFIEPSFGEKNVGDIELVIRDYLDGKIVYEKKLTVKEFTSMFSSRNLEIIYRFLENNIEDKKLVYENFIEELNERIIKRHR